MKEITAKVQSIYHPDYSMDMVKAAQGGNRDAQTDLYLIFLPMLKAIAKKRSVQYPDEREDLLGHLSCQFLILLAKYDGGKDPQFHKYLNISLNYEAIKYYYSTNKAKENLQYAGDEILNSYPMEDDSLDTLHNRMVLQKVLPLLKPEELALIKDRYVKGMTLKAIAEKYQVAISTVEKRLVKLLKNLRKAMALGCWLSF